MDKVSPNNRQSIHYPLHAAPFRQCLERETFLSVQTWKDEATIHLRLFQDGYPTPKGCVLNASRWTILVDHLTVIEEEMTKVQSGSSNIEYKVHLGGNVYATVTSPYVILDIRLHFTQDGKLLPTRKGVTLRFPGLIQLKQCISRVYDAIPRTHPCYMIHQNAQDEMAALTCKECSPNTYML